MRNEEIKIVKTVADHVDGITEVLRTAWLDTYPNEALGITREAIEEMYKPDEEKRLKRREFYNNPPENRLLLSAMDGDTVVGFINALKREDGDGQIKALYVHPKMIGKGIGARLMEEALTWLHDTKRIRVECASYNDRALKFYKKFGFTIDEEASKNIELFTLPNGVAIPEVVLFKNNH